MRCYLGESEFPCVLFHNVPDESFRYANTPGFACATDTSEKSPGRNRGCRHPLIDNRFHPVGYRNGSDVPAFTNEINYRPVLFALLQMPEVQISQFAASKSAAQQDGEDRTIPLSFERVRVRRLPKPTGFFGREPVPKPHTQLLCTFHTSDTSSEFRTEQASVRGFIGEPPYSGESSVNRSPASCRFSRNMR